MTVVGLIYIKHPKLERLGGPVTEEALETLHSRKGWRAATAKEVEQFELDQALAESGAAPNRAPAKTAAKSEWVDWAVAQGADRTAADGLTKDQLIADYGQEG